MLRFRPKFPRRTGRREEKRHDFLPADSKRDGQAFVSGRHLSDRSMAERAVLIGGKGGGAADAPLHSEAGLPAADSAGGDPERCGRDSHYASA